MRLKRLEIQGFKSFARPVSLDFGPGITAIVGPNGSGKSNISDALRWVMGEQSAKSLRGYKMEDIIFAGSDGKRPLGMAEVQLTLDNSDGFFPLDYAELTVTRRVYRSGESEFLINKQSCRLRDIHDLFTDTGLGREGYAIIGQGQIDAVLSVRPEDRRVLLEETAGIVKYRQRKEQALRKLEDTNMDLLRVTDILHELQGQLGPLQEQAEQAKLYLSLAERLQSVELDYYHLNWHGLEQKRLERKASLERLQSDYDQQGEQLGRLEEEKLRLQAEEKSLEDAIERHRQQLMDLTEGYNQGVHTIQLFQERLHNHKTRSEQLTGLIRARQEELQSLQGEDVELENKLQALLEQIRRQDEAIAQAEQGLEELQQRQKQRQQKSKELKDDFFEFMRELTERRNFQRSFAERQSSLESQIRSTQEELRRLEESRGQVTKEAARLAEEQAKLAQALTALAERETQTQTELDGMKEELARHQKGVRLKQEELTQITARLKTLQELEEGYEGYAFGVKRIMQSTMSQLVLGTVADVITVPAGLETAFEVALGGGLQNLITPSEAEAKEIIAWLQEVRGGRVTILPLDSIKGTEFSDDQKDILNQTGVLGTALDLLTFSEEYRPALASLLGRVVLTEDLDTALSLKRRLRRFSRIVTRDGSVVFPSGAMTGGSLNNRTSGLLARKGELEQLEAKTQNLQEQLQAYEKKEEHLSQSMVRGGEELAQLQEKELQAKLELQRVSQAKEQAILERESKSQAYGQLQAQSEELQTMLDQLGSLHEQAIGEVCRLEEEERARRLQIQEHDASLEEIASALELHARGANGERVQLAELKGMLENQRILLANLEQQKKTALKVLNEAQTELDTMAEAKLLYEATILETEQANEDRKRKKDQLQALIETKRQARQSVKADVDRLGTELVQMEKEQLKRERSLYRGEVELEQLEVSRQEILRILQERELSLESVLTRDVQVKESTLKRNMADLRNQIRELGLVNPGATQEYERVLERCSFLQAQLEDLNEARASLQDVIREMDKLCRTKLWDVFKRVQVEFQKIFSQLFLGGSAELVLTDPDSILTTGIDVMARPPGKKLQNLLVLSGGERALTAIALLFAIRRVKPTPFWVLDEIDAALDESNLQRFVDLMREFAMDTQFLVVTHRPQTMEAAQTLYGVTMGEEGFSQIISVALT